MTELQLNTKNSVLTTLAVFASANNQKDYKNAVPFAHVPNEIIGQWQSYRELRTKEWFNAIWNETELKSLDDFDLVVKKLILETKKDIQDVPEVLLDEKWIKVMKTAESCLFILESIR